LAGIGQDLKKIYSDETRIVENASLCSVVMLKTFVLLGCFLEEQWWISGIRYGSCSNWFVEVSFHLINQVFVFG